MFKDYDKYLSTSLKVYIFVLVLVFILKLVGMDYFGLDINNPIINNVNNFCLNYHLDYLWYSFTIYINLYFCTSLPLNDNSKKLKLQVIFYTLIFVLIKICENYIKNGILIFLIDFIYGLLVITAIKRFKINWKEIKKAIFVFLLTTLYQIITLVIRSVNYIEENNFILNTILSVDYILLIIITYKVYFMKGEIKLCGMDQCSSSLKKIHLRKSLKQLQRNLHKFKQLPKQERLSISIYIFLSLLWNTLSLVIILLVANLNHTFIECLFILTSFWLSKHAFGKPFHLPNMIQCFIISNLTYYTLNRITTPLGISIFIPILLGVGLSYITSKLVKKTYKKLYKGMPKELFDETILNVVDKNSVKYKICYDFYINKKSDLALSFEYNYSFAGIRKIKDRINDKIKELN